MLKTPVFPHHQLDVYRVAIRLALSVEELMCTVPRGHSDMTSQLRRASKAVVLLIAEGANKRARGEKRLRYDQARGECGETAAGIELGLALNLVCTEDAHEALELAARVNQMLTKLGQRWT